MGIAVATAQDSSSVIQQQLQQLQINQNTVWVLFTGSLVFFMNCGFAMLETGFCQKENGINVLAKNLIVFAITTVAFWLLGFGLMFGEGNFIGEKGFILIGADNSPQIKDAYQGVFSSLDWAAIPLFAKFFFQLTFAGAAVTIVSGAVAQRIKFPAFILFSFCLVLSYSISGHWVWGGGFLDKLGFRDFAGSTVVHSVGGWAGLVGAMLLQPRLKKYIPWQAREKRSLQQTSFRGNKIVTFIGHNLSIATLGCFILWLGWFGFNAGSTLSANYQAISHILVATLMAGAAGGLGAVFFAWWHYEKPSLSFLINGILAGCVSITASCAFVNLPSAFLIGFLGGIIVVIATIFLDKLEIDDPVGAIPVHLVCGIWGTLTVGLFSQNPNSYAWADQYFRLAKGGLLFGGGIDLLFAQVLGIVVVGGWTVVTSYLAWLGTSYFIYCQENSTSIGFRPEKGLRVKPDEEKLGLDSLFAEGTELLKHQDEQ
jgi:Amt family ammonium transporter